MPILTYVKVENLRSIRSTELMDIDDYSPLVGLNSSGKSNLLRALNLFFNGYLDEERAPLNFATDFTSYAPKGKKKSVSVTVGLTLGGDFNVRGQEEFHSTNAITDHIFIRRTWSIASDKLSLLEEFQFGPSLDHMRDANADETAAVLTHIRAIRFVYIPNHTRPADLIRSELEPLRSTLVSRLRASKAYKSSRVNELLVELGNMGDRMFGDVTDSMRQGIPSISVSADLPTDFADLVFSVGVKAITDGENARPPEFEGSGTQSFMLLHVLDLADRTRRGGGFGWVQASIWALEEPESFLHSGLREQFSVDLRNYAEDSRRQVIVTTHMDEFIRVADSAWVTERRPDTTFSKMSAREALLNTNRRSITSFSHPLFSFPTEPVVIVEGKFDHIYLRTALLQAGMRPRWRLLSPAVAFGEDIGGSAVLEYLKYNKQVIASRPERAPVIVLRDWEAKDKSKYDRVLKVHPFSTCLVAPEELVNPQLDESFVGIERYVSTDLVDKVVPSRKIGREHGGQDARYTIKRSTLESHKSALAAAAENENLIGIHMTDLAKWLDAKVAEILNSVPAESFV